MDAKNLIGGFIAGAAMGIAAGLLLAPTSGRKIRKQLAKDTLNLKNKIVEYIDSSTGDLRGQFNEKIDQLARRGKETINHVSEKIKV